jgi:hypothetical protein
MGTNPLESIPQAEISNGLIKARLYLPDTKAGYYRGSRFDWSGVIPVLEYDGHTYFGQWFEKYSPTLHDAIMGPVDDFYPIGYSDARTGESFLKIGIGMVTKPDEPKYSFANFYPIVNAGEWKVKKKSDRVEFFQKLDDKDYAYEYQKTVLLTKGKPQMVIEHVLKNTSAKLMETTVYNHNFFVLDKQPIGPDVEVTFPFNLTSETPGNEAFGRIQDNKIVFHKTLEKNEHLFYGSLQGFGETANDYDIRIENHRTGAAVRITCDQPLAKIVFWSAPKTVCPEPYIQLSLNPGETFRWNIVYQFYTSDTN